VVGGDPQDLQFDPATPSFVRVGDDTVIREGVTLNRALHAGVATEVGARCFLMANSHAGHDCVLGDGVILANNAMLAGHVEVGAGTFVGGGAGIHQFCRIGEGCMVAGLARQTLDLPPFCLLAERDQVVGLNLVGLKRRGLARETVMEIKNAYRGVYQADGNLRAHAAALVAETRSAEARSFLAFFEGGKRGFARPARPGRKSGGGDDA